MSKELIVVLDNIRSRENVGSIFRTADAVGVSKIYLCGITPQPPHEKIAKTALGAENTVPWEYSKQTWRLLDSLKKQGTTIVALEKTSGAKDIFSFQSSGKKIALVLGNEVKGLSPKTLSQADEAVSIPMVGQKESLNVAVAFGVAIYALSNS